jgi:hypothetical protein
METACIKCEVQGYIAFVTMDHPPGQTRPEHHRRDKSAGWLPFRTKHDGRTLPVRGLQGSDAGVCGKTAAGVQRSLAFLHQSPPRSTSPKFGLDQGHLVFHNFPLPGQGEEKGEGRFSPSKAPHPSPLPHGAREHRKLNSPGA